MREREGAGANEGEMTQHAHLCMSCCPFCMPGAGRERQRMVTVTRMAMA